MRSSSIALAVLAGSAGLAAAQPAPPPPPPDPAGSTTGGATATEVRNPEEQPPAPQPTPGPTTPAPAEEHHDLRPTELSFGIGAGWTFSTSLETPNTVSVRLRLPGGLAFEPIVRLRNLSHTATPVTGPDVTDQTTEVGASVNVLFPIWHRGRADFDLVGTLAFDTEKVTPDTSASDVNKNTTTFGVGYGIEVGFWISRHWLVTMTATNPIFTLAQTTNNMVGGMTTKDSTTSVGLIHDPTVALQIHLFN
jgi:hypothetical protein